MSQAGIVVKQVSTGGAISSSSGEKKKILMLGVLGEEGKRIILCKIPSERFFPHFADWPATQPGTAWQRGGGRRRRKKTTTKKKNPTRRHKHLVHLSKPFLNLSKKRRTIQSRSLRWLPLLFWTGPYWFRIKSQSTEPNSWNVSGWCCVIIFAVACSSSVSAWRNSNTCRKTWTLNERVDERSTRKNKHGSVLNITGASSESYFFVF